MTDAETGAVRCLGTQLFHELSTFMHPVVRLRLMRFDGEKARNHFVPQFRHGRRQGVVSHQLFVGRRHLYWLEESGESDERAFSSSRQSCG
jgi:hypothetical protein